MAGDEHIWKALISPNAPATVFGDDQRTWVFPNVIEETLLECVETTRQRNGKE
jgi:hypothetical protein